MLGRRFTFIRRHTTLELVTLTSFLIIVAVLGADIAAVVVGDHEDAAACRQAAAIASQSADARVARGLAQATLDLHHKSFAASGFQVNQFVYQDYGGRPTVNEHPFVLVSTSAQVHVPAPVLFDPTVVGTDGNITFTHSCKLPLRETSAKHP